MDKMISIAEAAKILGVTPRTLIRWDEDGKLNVYRTLGNHRRYRLSDVEALLGIKNEKNVFIYVRVANKKQANSGNLERQKNRLVEYCKNNKYNICHIYEEIANGLNASRKELIQMFRHIDEINMIIIESADKLAVLGYTYFEAFAKESGVIIEIVEEKEKLEAKKDNASGVNRFSARFSGEKGHRKVKRD